MAHDVLYVLQNAWRHNGRQNWRQQAWEYALWKSPTGKRLKEMIPEGVSYAVCNASPVVGSNSKSRFPADPVHVSQEIERYQPAVLVLCGTVAGELAAVFRNQLPIVTAPHPAWRLLRKEATAALAAEIAGLVRQGVRA